VGQVGIKYCRYTVVGIKYCRYTVVAQKMYNIEFVFTMFSRGHRLYLSESAEYRLYPELPAHILVCPCETGI
jgi:hypothetical protein